MNLDSAWAFSWPGNRSGCVSQTFLLYAAFTYNFFHTVNRWMCVCVWEIDRERERERDLWRGGTRIGRQSEQDFGVIIGMHIGQRLSAVCVNSSIEFPRRNPKLTQLLLTIKFGDTWEVRLVFIHVHVENFAWELRRMWSWNQ